MLFTFQALIVTDQIKLCCCIFLIVSKIIWPEYNENEVHCLPLFDSDTDVDFGVYIKT